LGKYYSRHRGSLYIYVTGKDEMIDLKVFPPELNLFESETSWRVTHKIANCSGTDEFALERAENILQIQGFTRKDYDRVVLENYFLLGDETVFEMVMPSEVPAPSSFVAEERVIVPTVTRPPSRRGSPLFLKGAKSRASAR